MKIHLIWTHSFIQQKSSATMAEKITDEVFALKHSRLIGCLRCNRHSWAGVLSSLIGRAKGLWQLWREASQDTDTPDKPGFNSGRALENLLGRESRRRRGVVFTRGVEMCSSYSRQRLWWGALLALARLRLSHLFQPLSSFRLPELHWSLRLASSYVVQACEGETTQDLKPGGLSLNLSINLGQLWGCLSSFLQMRNGNHDI